MNYELIPFSELEAVLRHWYDGSPQKLAVARDALIYLIDHAGAPTSAYIPPSGSYIALTWPVSGSEPGRDFYGNRAKIRLQLFATFMKARWPIPGWTRTQRDLYYGTADGWYELRFDGDGPRTRTSSRRSTPPRWARCICDPYGPSRLVGTECSCGRSIRG